MNALVIKHVDCEGPGVLRDVFDHLGESTCVHGVEAAVAPLSAPG